MTNSNKQFLKQAEDTWNALRFDPARGPLSPLSLAVAYAAHYARKAGFPSARVLRDGRHHSISLAREHLCGCTVRITSVTEVRMFCATLDAVEFTQKTFTRAGTRRRDKTRRDSSVCAQE